MRTVFAFFITFSSAIMALPMTNQQASDAGTTLATQGDAAATPQITQTNANTQIQHVTGTPPETAFFGGGQANNYMPGDTKRINCASGTPNPDKWTQQSCDAVNLISRGPSQRPHFAISRNDPMLQREQAVRANPAQVAFGASGANPASNATTSGAAGTGLGGTAGNPNGFGVAGNYSTCNTTTTPDPGTSTMATCVDYLSSATVTSTPSCQKSAGITQTCDKTLTVTVTSTPAQPSTTTIYCHPVDLNGWVYGLMGCFQVHYDAISTITVSVQFYTPINNMWGVGPTPLTFTKGVAKTVNDVGTCFNPDTGESYSCYTGIYYYYPAGGSGGVGAVYDGKVTLSVWEQYISGWGFSQSGSIDLTPIFASKVTVTSTVNDGCTALQALTM